MFASLIVSAAAHADPLVAIAPDPTGKDIAQAILVGPAGQVYAPDGAGWTRSAAGGIAAGATTAARPTAGELLAARASTPAYRWHDGAWTAQPLPAKGALVLGVGPAAAAAVDTAIFVRGQDGAWARVATAPSAPAGLWAASATQIWIVADGAAWHLRGKAFERGPAAAALAQGVRPLAIAADRAQVMDLSAGKAVKAAAGITAVASGGADTWLLLGDGKVERHNAKRTDTLAPPAHAWAWIWADAHGRVAVAAPTGEVAIFDGNAWRDAPVATAAPTAHAGPGPATSP